MPHLHTIAVFAVTVIRTRNLTLQEVFESLHTVTIIRTPIVPARQRRGMGEQISDSCMGVTVHHVTVHWTWQACVGGADTPNL